MNLMLRWISEYCSSKQFEINLRKFVLFIDDDYYLNIHSLINFIKSLNENPSLTLHQRRTFITGHVYNSSRPRRFINDRWYISLTEYPYDRYPPYVTAGCFLMSKSNVKLFHLASKYVPFFRFDDIYMGLLAYSMSIELIENNQLFSSYNSNGDFYKNQTGFFKRWKKFFTNEIQADRLSQIICVHGYRGEKLIELWNDIYHTNLTLSNKSR